MSDVEFEAEVRAMLFRRAGDVADPTEAHGLPADPLTSSAGHRPPPTRWLVGAVAIVVVVVAVVGVLAQRSDVVRTVGPVGAPTSTSQPEVTSSASTVSEATLQIGWGTSVPSAGLFPQGFVLVDAIPVFSAEGDLRFVASLYLDDRFPDLDSLEIGIELVEVSDDGLFGLVSWQWGQPDQPEGFFEGLLYMRGDRVSWHVMASTSPALDLSGLRLEESVLSGAITSSDINAMFIDVLNLSDMRPVGAAPRPTGMNTEGYLIGSAAGPAEGRIDISLDVGDEPILVRAQLVGGTVLAISEFELSENQAMGFALVSEFEAAILEDGVVDYDEYERAVLAWRDCAVEGGVSVQGLEYSETAGQFEYTHTEPIEVADDCYAKYLDDVEIEWVVSGSRTARSPLIVGNFKRGEPLVVVPCDGAGNGVPATKAGQVDPLHHPTAHDAVRVYVDSWKPSQEGPNHMPQDSWWVQSDGDSLSRYAWAAEESAIAPSEFNIVLTVEHSSSGWAVTRWEASGC